MGSQTIREGFGVRVRVSPRGIASVQIVNGDLIVTFTDGTTQNAGSVGNGGGTPTPTPTPTASFVMQPNMSGDGSPQVGEVSAFDFGAIANGTVGTVRLFRNGADYADGSIGSFQWTEAGAYFLRVTIAGTSIAADSAPLTVVALTLSDVPAPTLSNPDNFVSGSNPPRFRVDIPYADGANVPFDKSLHDLHVEWDRAATGTFTYDASRSAIITDLMAFANAEDATIAALANQPPGSVFRVRTYFVRKADSVAGPYSNYWIDTLAAAQITPTTFDPDLATGVGLYPAVRLSTDKLTAYNLYGGNPSGQFAYAIYARGIGSKIAFRPNAANGGIFLSDGTGNSHTIQLGLYAGGYSAFNGQQISDYGFAINDIVAIELVANQTTPANIDALVTKTGGTPTRFVLNSPNPLYAGVFLGNDEGPNFTMTDNTHWGTA